MDGSQQQLQWIEGAIRAKTTSLIIQSRSIRVIPYVRRSETESAVSYELRNSGAAIGEPRIRRELGLSTEQLYDFVIAITTAGYSVRQRRVYRFSGCHHPHHRVAQVDMTLPPNRAPCMHLESTQLRA